MRVPVTHLLQHQFYQTIHASLRIFCSLSFSRALPLPISVGASLFMCNMYVCFAVAIGYSDLSLLKKSHTNMQFNTTELYM